MRIKGLRRNNAAIEIHRWYQNVFMFCLTAYPAYNCLICYCPP